MLYTGNAIHDTKTLLNEIYLVPIGKPGSQVLSEKISRVTKPGLRNDLLDEELDLFEIVELRIDGIIWRSEIYFDMEGCINIRSHSKKQII